MGSVSVVIPTLNEEQSIGTLLAALSRQTQSPDEIIVVDGGSTDATVELASRHHEARVIVTRPPVGAQRQLGLEAASGGTVVFLDADTIPPPGFIAGCLSELKARRLDVACPYYSPHPSSPFIAAIYLFFNLIFFALQKVTASGAGSCIIVNRAFALRVGGFRSDLVYEDIEFIRRASRRGRFGIVRSRIAVSDRRFREFGAARTFLKYLALSLFFFFGLFKLAGLIGYPFARYGRNADNVVVLVDEGDEPLGVAPKDFVHASCTPLHRGFSLFVLNSRGELLLQQRSRLKRTWPLEWSNSCCGHPLPGETVEDAAKRRATEELGITLSELYKVLPDYRYRASKDGVEENETCPVLVGVTTDPPAPDPSEVRDVRWVPWEVFADSVRRQAALTPWCSEEAQLLDASREFHRILRATRGHEK